MLMLSEHTVCQEAMKEGELDDYEGHCKQDGGEELCSQMTVDPKKPEDKPDNTKPEENKPLVKNAAFDPKMPEEDVKDKPAWVEFRKKYNLSKDIKIFKTDGYEWA